MDIDYPINTPCGFSFLPCFSRFSYLLGFGLSSKDYCTKLFFTALFFTSMSSDIRKQRTAAIAKADERLLAELGYKQEFQRAFTPHEVYYVIIS